MPYFTIEDTKAKKTEERQLFHKFRYQRLDGSWTYFELNHKFMDANNITAEDFHATTPAPTNIPGLGSECYAMLVKEEITEGGKWLAKFAVKTKAGELKQITIDTGKYTVEPVQVKTLEPNKITYKPAPVEPVEIDRENEENFPIITNMIGVVYTANGPTAKGTTPVDTTNNSRYEVRHTDSSGEPCQTTFEPQPIHFPVKPADKPRNAPIIHRFSEKLAKYRTKLDFQKTAVQTGENEWTYTRAKDGMTVRLLKNSWDGYAKTVAAGMDPNSGALFGYCGMKVRAGVIPTFMFREWNTYSQDEREQLAKTQYQMAHNKYIIDKNLVGKGQKLFNFANEVVEQKYSLFQTLKNKVSRWFNIPCNPPIIPKYTVPAPVVAPVIPQKIVNFSLRPHI